MRTYPESVLPLAKREAGLTMRVTGWLLLARVGRPGKTFLISDS